ncbi:hypothetical protein IQ07DRAFT_682939 [Pyrenochaeta sp. DS3sAY3a]|nr:hypothetical protein IQ07DRAFT_682939 [Pyrenochaeta sp. DS3sAY3a]
MNHEEEEAALHELPAYTPPGSTGQPDPISDDDISAGEGVGPERGRYAKQVQKACRQALKTAKRENVLMNSEWAAPLEAAPTAIIVMAFLIKTAANEKVAGLEVKSTEVMDETGMEHVGTLPSKYFHTNLMHCSDIGRLAFLDAQNRMQKISVVSRSMMKDGGRLSYIVELLEDAEDAKYNLKPEMELLKKQATECSEECELIQKKFEYWHFVINHLSKNALDNIAGIREDGKTIANSKQEAKISKKAYSIEEQAIRDSIKDLRENVTKANQKVLKAEKEVTRLNNLPPLPEPDHFDELAMAQQLAPEEAHVQRQRGFFSDLASGLFGTSKKHHREDEDARDAHYAKHLDRQKKIIEESRSERQRLIKQAKDRRNEAREEVNRLENELDEKQSELASKKDGLSQAQQNLAKASADLERLDREELELKEILSILKESTHELGKLKTQLGRLRVFFATMENNISKNAMHEVDAFLEILGRNIRRNDEDVETLRLRGASKRKVLSSAMQIQGQFSVIADVSAAYVTVSDQYIRKAIDKMEDLATIEDSKWPGARQEFTKWCNDAVKGINGVAKQASANMAPNMQKRIGLLQTLAIEAAEDNEE